MCLQAEKVIGIEC